MFLHGRIDTGRNMFFRGVAQFGGAPGLGPGGRRFESCHLDLYYDPMIPEVC